ncbi:MAG: 23S rRNA (uracil(1939)-C(5))-methyltransferase RlmD [Deltaproteobacteria bacterium]
MAVELQIVSLAHGGDGVGRLDGAAVFVPGTAPGDLAEIELLRGKSRPARGRLLRLLGPGPGRVQPSCPLASECGGCQWQHVSAEAQLAAKAQNLEEALRRIGRLAPASVPAARAIASPSDRRYRRRTRLAVSSDRRVGFLARGSHRIVPVDRCELMTEPLEAAVAALAQALRNIDIPGLEQLEVCEAGGEAAAELVLSERATLGRALERAAQLLALCGAATPKLVGLVITKGRTKQILGRPVLSDEGLLLRPDVFAQANRAGNRLLVVEAIAALALAPTDRVLELHAGSGNFTFPLARASAHVLAVEEEGEALALARRTVPPELAGRLEWRAGRAEVVVPGLRGPFDRALLDPPRAGARELMPLLAALGVPRIVYVSCDPATLARDVGELSRLGYRVASAVVIDMFPQTFHAEAVVALERH